MNLGKATKVRFLGKEWTVGRAEFPVFEEYFDWLKELIGDPLEDFHRVIDHLTPELVKQEYDELKALRNAVKSMDITRPALLPFFSTPRGMTHFLYLCLKVHHPDVEEDIAFQMLIGLGGEEIGRILNRSIGEAPQGNAEASAPEPPTTA